MKKAAGEDIRGKAKEQEPAEEKAAKEDVTRKECGEEYIKTKQR